MDNKDTYVSLIEEISDTGTADVVEVIEYCSIECASAHGLTASDRVVGGYPTSHCAFCDRCGKFLHHAERGCDKYNC